MRSVVSIVIFSLLLAITASRAADLTEKETKAGKKIYTAKCAKCHKFYNPNDYNAEEWQSWMVKMNKKAKLKPDQAELLSRYIDTIRTTEKADGKKHS
jgi:mono/diheme cytochrome c family protein